MIRVVTAGAVIFMSLLTFALFGIDKWKAGHHRWRIPEATLLLSSFLLGGIGGLFGMLAFRHKTRKRKFRILVPLFALLQVISLGFLLWTSYYYHADSTAAAAMQPDGEVSVMKTSTGWLFDGPSDDTGFIFFPGAKVEAEAYAPMLHELAGKGTDVYLVRMPLNLAFFGMKQADAILKQSSFSRYYIGGHSLGGAMAASWAAGRENVPDGVILFAAYPVRELDTDVLLMYGSEDKIVNGKKIEAAENLVRGRFREAVIEGGNHAQFGNYGVQKGDGTAGISAEEQQRQAVELILAMMDDSE